MSTSRYPGTKPFTDSPEDVARFFGRVTESEELYLRVLSVPLLVQFGKSGLGKTSLLQAGLFPLLRQKTFLPVMVRLNEPSEPVVAAVERGIVQSCNAENLKYKPVPVTGLWDLLDDLMIWRDGLLLTPVLVFDQFEEVFTLRDAAFRRGLAEELGSLAMRIPPKNMPPGSPPPDVKLIISLREDYLGSLEEFAAVIPNLFHERLRLEALSDRSARIAITQPASLKGDYSSPPFAFAEPLLEAMIAYLKGTSGVIEPFQLQLLCQHAEKVATRKAGADESQVTLTLDDFEQGQAFASVLNRFYSDTIAKVPQTQRRRVVRLCEEGLLGAAGHRLMLEERQIRDDYRVTPETLKILADERLIRRERRQESVFYEISHDRLAESIRNARALKLPRKAKRTLWVAAAILLGIILANYFYTRAVNRSLARAEALNSFLLGESFLGEVRDGGRSSLMKLLRDRIAEEDLTPFNEGLARRNSGDIERTTGRVGDAIALYRQALPFFDANSTDPATVREAARTHFRLGDTFSTTGEPSDAVPHLEQAVGLWQRVTRGEHEVTSDDCISLTETLIASAEARGRLGQTKRALADLEQASGVLGDILFGHHRGPEKCSPASGVEPYPDAKALQMLARVAAARSGIVGGVEDFEGATTLAVQASALNPPSISAREDAFVARAMRGNARRATRPDLAIEDYRQALAEADVLRRWDLRNRDWQRERAANQLLLAEIVAECHANPDRQCGAVPLITTAQAISLEALATMRALADFDPENASLRDDVAWAFNTYAKTLAEPTEQLAVLEQGLRAYANRPADEGDSQSEFNRADLLAAKAVALDKANRDTEARAVVRASAEVLGRLTQRNPENIRLLEAFGSARIQEAELGRDAGDMRAATAAEAEAEQLSVRIEKILAPVNARLSHLNDLDHQHRERGIALIADGKLAEAVQELQRSEAAVREYARVRPTEFGAYRDLAKTYDALATAYTRLQNVEARGAALRAAMHAAQLAVWLAQEEDAASMNRLLLGSRLALATYLLGRRDFGGAATIVQEAAAAAESLAHDENADPFYLYALGRATCSLGDIRLLSEQAGAQEAYRSGIIHLRRAAPADPLYARALAACEQSLRQATVTSTPQPAATRPARPAARPAVRPRDRK